MILKLTIILLYLLTLPTSYQLTMAEIPTIYSFQKDSFSHVNLTIPNTDICVVLDNNTPRMLPHHKVAIFWDCLEPMWDFSPHFIKVLDDIPEDAQVTTDQMVPVPNLIQQNGYPTLTTDQALVSNCMVIPFSIQPCESLNWDVKHPRFQFTFKVLKFCVTFIFLLLCITNHYGILFTQTWWQRILRTILLLTHLPKGFGTRALITFLEHSFTDILKPTSFFFDNSICRS